MLFARNVTSFIDDNFEGCPLYKALFKFLSVISSSLGSFSLGSLVKSYVVVATEQWWVACCITQVEVALMSAKTAPGGTDISSRVYDAVSNIEACLEIMANSKDLYHTELHEDLRDKVEIQSLELFR